MKRAIHSAVFDFHSLAVLEPERRPGQSKKDYSAGLLPKKEKSHGPDDGYRAFHYSLSNGKQFFLRLYLLFDRLGNLEAVNPLQSFNASMMTADSTCPACLLRQRLNLYPHHHRKYSTTPEIYILELGGGAGEPRDPNAY